MKNLVKLGFFGILLVFIFPYIQVTKADIKETNVLQFISSKFYPSQVLVVNTGSSAGSWDYPERSILQYKNGEKISRDNASVYSYSLNIASTTEEVFNSTSNSSGKNNVREEKQEENAGVNIIEISTTTNAVESVMEEIQPSSSIPAQTIESESALIEEDASQDTTPVDTTPVEEVPIEPQANGVIDKVFNTMLGVVPFLPQGVRADQLEISTTTKVQVSSPYIEVFGFNFGEEEFEKLYLNMDIDASLYVGKINVYISSNESHSIWENIATFNSLDKSKTKHSFPIREGIDLKYLAVRVEYVGEEIESLLVGNIHIEAQKKSLTILDLFESENFNKDYDIAVGLDNPEEILLTSTLFKMGFPKTLEDSIVLFSKDDFSNALSMNFLGASASSTVSRRGNSITYNDAFPKTNVEYEVQGNNLKEYIHLIEKGHPDLFAYASNLSDFDLVQTNSSTITLYKKGHQGEDLYKLYTITAPIMTDAAGNSSDSITLQADGNSILLIPDPNWISNAIYPVMVDPTVEINVLNLHSHPQQGENWDVDFTTIGTENLTITPADQATIDDDEFTSLFCGDEDRTSNAQILPDDVIFYPDWNCDEVARVTHLTLKAGSHHLLFQFGEAQSEAFNAAYTWDGGGGDAQWDTAANWSSDVVPTSADTVTFDNTCVSNCNPTIATTTTIGGLTIASTYAGTITQADGYTLTIHFGTFSQAGGTFNGGTGTTTFNSSNFTISGGTFNPATTTYFYHSGNNVGDHTININTSETFYDLKFYSLGQNSDTWTISSGDTLVVTNNTFFEEGYVDTGIIDTRGNIIQYSGSDGGTAIVDFGDNSVGQTWTINGGLGPNIRFDSASDASDSVVFNAAGGMAGGTTTSSFSGTIPFSNSSNYAITIGTSGWQQAAGTFNEGPADMTINGVFTLSGGTFNGGTATTTIQMANFTISGGTFNAATTTYFYKSQNNVGNHTINVSTSQNFYNLKFYGAGQNTETWVITSGDTLIVNGTLSLLEGDVDTGTIDTRGNIIQYPNYDGGSAVVDFNDDSVAQTWTINGGTGPVLRLDSSSDANDSIVFNAAGGLSGATTTSSFSGTIPFSNSSNYNISIGGNGWLQAAGTFNQGGANFTTVFASFTLSGGTFNGGTATTTFQSTNFTISGGTFNAATTTYFYHSQNNAGNHTINVNTSQTFHNLKFYHVGVSANTWTISSGDTLISTGVTDFIDGFVNTGTVSAQGNVIVWSTFDGGTAPLIFSGSSNQSFDLTGATGLFNGDISVNKSGGEVQLASTLTMDAASQDLVIQEGTFNTNGNTLTVNGSSGTLVVQDGGVLKINGDETITANANNPQLQSGSTVEYAGSGSYTPKGYSYSNISISGSGSFSATSGPFYIGNNFTQSAGTFTASAGTTTIAGDITRTGGTFTHNSGVVELNGTTQAINDSTTFNNLYKVVSSADNLTFEAGATTTVAGTMTLRGASGNILTLQSSSDGIPWYVDPQSTRNIQYLDVNDSYNSNGTVINAESSNSTDGGGNTNWIFETNAPTAGTVVVSDTQLDSITISISGASDDTALATLPYVFRNVTTDYYFLATSSTFATSTGLSSGTSYTFEVGVYDVYGNSATTTSVSGSTLTPSSDGDSDSSGGSSGGSSSGNGRGGVSQLFSLLINGGDFYTNTSNVNLSFVYPVQSNVSSILISRFSNFFDPVNITSKSSSDWILCGFDSCPNGEYFVFAKYLDNKNKTLGTVSDSIILQTITTTPPPIISIPPANPPNGNGSSNNPPKPNPLPGEPEILNITLNVSAGSGDYLPISYGSTLTSFEAQIKTSTSIKGKINYEIDWNNDGIFDSFISSNSKTINTPEYNFAIPGDYFVKVKASASGLESIASARIIVEDPQFDSLISGSLDRKNWSDYLEAPLNSKVSFHIESFGNIDGWYSYSISCDLSGEVERNYKRTTRTTYIARNTCLYTQNGIYTVTLTATNGTLLSTSHMSIVVGNPIVIPPPIPPIGTTTPPVSTSTDPGVPSIPPTPTPTSTPPIGTTTPSIPGDSTGGVEIGENVVDIIIADVAVPLVDHASFIAASIFADISENRILSALASLLLRAFSVLSLLLTLLKNIINLIRSNPEAVAIISSFVALPILALLRNMLSPLGVRNLFDLYAGALSVFNNFLTWSHLRTKRRYWGMVYDSENKQPIDPAIVTLTDINTGKVVETAVTDLYGRYGFMNYMGQFRIGAKKTHYTFPSNKVSGNSDGLFNNVYHGEVINIEKLDDLITPNIPMDRMFYDWNQEFKTVHIHPRIDYILSSIFRVFSWSFTAIVVYLFVFNTSIITTISLLFTIVIAIVSYSIPTGKLWGEIKDRNNRDISIVLYYEGLSNVVVSHAIISSNGRYFLKTLPGKYVLSVRGSKSGLEIYKTGVRVGKVGVVNKKIDISEYAGV